MSNIYRLRSIERVVPNFSEDVTLIRVPKGGYDSKGRWKAQDPETKTIKASVHPASDEDLVKVDEGRRTRGGIKIYTDVLLQTASVGDQHQPDIIEWQGNQFQVETIDNWSGYGFYYKALATKMGQ